MNRKAARVMALVVAALTSPWLVWAQTAQVTGRITDTSGGVVPGATLTVSNVETGIGRTTASNAEGYYVLPLLPRGTYTIAAMLDGFKPQSRTGVVLAEGQLLRLDFTLEVGGVSERIEVRGASLLESGTPSMSTVIPNQKILDLPVVSRNPIAFAALAPGVRGVGDFGGLPVSSFDGARLSIGGGPPGSNNYQIDGAATENFTSGGMNVFLSVDAVEEFRIITRNPGAEFGRTGGGVVQVISKSGTNAFKGTGYEFYRSDKLNANNFFSNRAGRAKPPLSFHEWGATLGGPIVRQKTFFFFNYEGFRERTSEQTTRTVPTELQRRGDFSQTFDPTGNLVVIYDPLTTQPDPGRPGQFVRQPFAGNVIPPERLSPVTRAVLNRYPLPNQPGVGRTGANNFFGTAEAPQDKSIYGIKIDHNFTPERRLSGRFTRDYSFRGSANFYGNEAEINSSDLPFYRRSVAVNYTDALSSTWLLEAKAGLNRYAPERAARSLGFDVSTIGLPASLNAQTQIQIFPLFNIADLTAIGGSQFDHLIQFNEAWTTGASVLKTAGAHTLKFGGEFRYYRLYNTQGGPVMQFGFGRGYTQGPNPNVTATTAGHGLATFLLGGPTSGEAVRYPFLDYRATNTGLYAQDDWKLTSRLTLNLGLRWELESAVTEATNQLSNFEPTLQVPLGGLTVRGALRYPGVDGVPRGFRDNEYTNFGPRVGVSYQLTPATLARAAYGLYYLPGTGNFVQLAAAGFRQQTPMVTSIDGGLTPFRTVSNPFPDGITPAPGSSRGALTGLGTGVQGELRDLKVGRSHQWNLNVQRELPGNWVVELAYVGNRGRHLWAPRAFDYLPASARQLGSQLQQQVSNPFVGLITSGPLAQPTVTRATLIDTYPHFLGASGLDDWAESTYHAATVKTERRFSAGLSVLASYTWSKLRDNNIGNGSNGFTAGGSEGVQNWDDLDAEYAVSSNNLPHRFVAAVLYELPLGRQGPRLVRTLIGGWHLTGIVTAQSGNTIAVTQNAPAFGGFRPNLVGDPRVEDPTIDRWLNREAFQPIAPFTLGNAPRNLPTVQTDGLFNVDLAVLKSLPIKRTRLELRGEFYNLLNSPQFGAPGTNISAGNFGVVSSTANRPRQIQLAVKLYF